MSAAEALPNGPRLSVAGTAPETAVAWIGAVPPWLGTPEAGEELGGIRLEYATRAAGPFAPHTEPEIVHATTDAAGELVAARAAFRSAKLVLDLGADAVSAADSAVQQALDVADLVVVDSAWAERSVARSRPALSDRVRVVPRPLDLAWHAPEASLLKTRGAHLKRFQRFHRIGHPVVMFVGPYTQGGGLDLALEAVYRLRDEIEDIRLSAIPLGPTDQAWLDRCEMRALGLGHRGIIEWAPEDDDLPLWYAMATVVCTPWRVPGPTTPARLAAAAAHPVVTSRVAGTDDVVGTESTTVVAPDDVDALVAALRPLLLDRDEADRLGAGARSRAESALAPAAWARQLADTWTSIAGTGGR